MNHFTRKAYTVLITAIILLLPVQAQRQMELLDRGAIAIKTDKGVYLSWRLNANEGKDAAFNIYRNDSKVNLQPVTNVTNYEDTAGKITDIYKIKLVKDGIETDDYKYVKVWNEPVLRIPLNCPSNGTDPNGVAYTYNIPEKASTECSIADLDGDGEYEIIVKWEPSNWKDNETTGFTGNTYIDAYKLDGTQLWRIDLGKNIRSGPHYTQFMVYDFNGDGRAEMVCKTAPGTIDGAGQYVIMGSDDPTADYRNLSTSGNNRKGYILKGPEYLTLFDGATGAEMHTVAYEPARGTISSWGDSYGNRVDRFLACVAYLDGVHPSVVMCRGYYTRAVLVAYDVVDSKLVKRWTHDSPTKGQGAYGEGNHNLSVADIDGDGFDEIVYGACAIDHDGTLLYRTGFGHGDAMHLTKIDPDLDGLQVFCVHEENSASYGYEMREAKTGKVIFGAKTGFDVGRGVCADIDSRYRGKESWPIKAENETRPVFDCKGNIISTSRPRVCFRVYWTGDLQDELFEKNLIYKWDENKNKDYLYKTFATDGAVANVNDRPPFSADIFGDWREEIALLNNNCELMIFTTTENTDHRLYTLMHDPVYRLGIAWQNVAYNQPPHLGFYIGDGMDDVPWPDMYQVKADQDLVLNKKSIVFDGSIAYSSLKAIPLGGLAGDVDWSVADNSIVKISPDADNRLALNIYAAAIGSTTITAKLGDFEKTIPVTVSDLKITRFEWNPTTTAKTWDEAANYLPATATVPGVGDTVVVNQEMNINAVSYSATILLEQANLRFRANAVSSADIIMKEGTQLSFATSGTGFSLNAKIKLEGDIELKMSGSADGNYMELIGGFHGNTQITVFNNTNAENVESKVILSGNNSNFYGIWDATKDSRVASSYVVYEGKSEQAFGNAKIVIGTGNKVIFSHEKSVSPANELSLQSGAKAVLSKSVTVGKLTLGETEYTSGTFSASTHAAYFEGTGMLTVGETTSLLQYDNTITFDGEHIISGIDIASINVYNTIGILVEKKTINAKRASLLAQSGLYIIEIRFTDGGKTTKKVFIK